MAMAQYEERGTASAWCLVNAGPVVLDADGKPKPFREAQLLTSMLCGADQNSM